MLALSALHSPPAGLTGSAGASSSFFAAEIGDFLRAERFPRQRAAHFHGREVLVVRSPATSLVLHLLPTPRCEAEVLPPLTSAGLADAFAARRRPSGRRSALVHLWEDQWHEHGDIVRSRLLSMLGRSTRLAARATTARRIDAATTDAFLLRNHLWGATKARYRYGLYLRPTTAGAHDEELVAVASFSARWKVRRRGAHDAPRASHELIRYCSRRGENVVGGISKLIAAFVRDAHPDEIVTVIDRDWGAGGGWATLGFTSLKKLPPVTFYVGADGLRCHPGAGPNPHRRRLPPELFESLEAMRHDDASAGDGDSTADDADTAAERFLAAQGFYPVNDAGAERHLLLVTPRADDGPPEPPRDADEPTSPPPPPAATDARGEHGATQTHGASFVRARTPPAAMQLSSGLSFDDAEMLLVSVQKPLGLLLEEIEVEAREVEGSEVVESAAMASEPGAGGGGGVVVVEVSDVGSAARAGVAAGDRLLAVNNQDVSDAPLEQVLAHLAAAPRVLNLRFLRGGRT